MTSTVQAAKLIRQVKPPYPPLAVSAHISGTVRLVDRMAESGYVRRGPGDDGRSTSVSLTGAGLAAAEAVTAARARVLAGALDALSPAEREMIAAYVSARNDCFF